jgi:hypothetical protein
MKVVLAFAVLLIVLAAFSYMTQPEHSLVEVKYTADEASAPLSYVSVILGGDKSGVADIEPNHSKSIKIYPKEDSQMILAVRVSNGAGEGPSDSIYYEESYKPGDQIRVLINVNQEGKVTSRETCKLPCSFD